MHEPPFVNEPEMEVPLWLCLNCRHTWEPEGEWEYDEGHYFSPDDESRKCPVCGSTDTDESFD